MSVYQATEITQFRKLVQFLKSQPSGSLSFRCWSVRFSDCTENSFLTVLEQNPRLRIYYVEDEEGKVRAIFAPELRGVPFNPKEPKIATMGFACIDAQDVASNNRVYYSKLLDYLVRLSVNNGYLRGEFCATEEKATWSKDFFGDAMQIKREILHPKFGKLILYSIDYQKYVEANP